MPGARAFWIVVLVLLALNYLIVALFAPGQGAERDDPVQPGRSCSRSTQNNVKRDLRRRATTVAGEFKNRVTLPGRARTASRPRTSTTEIPSFANTDAALQDAAEDHNVEISGRADQRRAAGSSANLILGVRPGDPARRLFVWLGRRAAAGGQMGALGAFGRSRARRVEGGTTRRSPSRTSPGIDEAKAELTEVVDFLKQPRPLPAASAAGSRAACCSPGAPGTGKTLLARAVAGEAGVPFFSISASEFVEAIVGIGASRVRDLFKQAKEAAPAIIFIDELDAIGRARARRPAPFCGGNDEREQTLNQILTEMDGFEPGRHGDRARRDEPPRGPRRRAAAPGPLRPPRDRARARQGRAAARSSRSTRARCRSTGDVDLDGSPRSRPAWSAPTSPTSPTRRR